MTIFKYLPYYIFSLVVIIALLPALLVIIHNFLWVKHMGLNKLFNIHVHVS